MSTVLLEFTKVGAESWSLRCLGISPVARSLASGHPSELNRLGPSKVKRKDVQRDLMENPQANPISVRQH
jgi:hypothetical protein